jgi:hypothetical protein
MAVRGRLLQRPDARGSSLRNDRNGGFAFSDKAAAKTKAGNDNSQRKCKPFHEIRPFLEMSETMSGYLWLFASLKQQDAQPCHSQERHYGDHVHHRDHVHRAAPLIIRGSCADLVNEGLTQRGYNPSCSAVHSPKDLVKSNTGRVFRLFSFQMQPTANITIVGGCND